MVNANVGRGCQIDSQTRKYEQREREREEEEEEEEEEGYERSVPSIVTL
jgi:hypothetical protein